MTGSKLAEFWDEEVPKHWKHFVGVMRRDKTGWIVDRLSTFHAKSLNERVGTILDWGCGGGLLTDWFLDSNNAERSVCADLSADSLGNAKGYLGPKYGDAVSFVHVSPNPADVAEDLFGEIDLILCHDVIHHFPGIGYFREMMGLWSAIGPKYMLLNFKSSPKLHEESDEGYFENKRYLAGLTMPHSVYVDEIEQRGYTEVASQIFQTQGNPNPKVYSLLVRK